MPYADPEKNREYNRRWFQRNKEHRRKQGNIWWRNQRADRKEKGLCMCCGKTPRPGKLTCEKRRRWAALSDKGLNREEQIRGRAMLECFDGKCQCCGTTDFGKREPHLDHKSGRVRGIICGHCNAALGYVKDNPLTARSLATYLERQG